MLQEEAQHFTRRVWAFGVSVAAVCLAAGPGVASTINLPQFGKGPVLPIDVAGLSNAAANGGFIMIHRFHQTGEMPHGLINDRSPIDRADGGIDKAMEHNGWT